MPNTTTNERLIEIALQIAAKDAEQQELLARGAKLPSSLPVRRALERRASWIDDDICQLCTELRIACLPPPSAADRAIAALPDCVAAAMLDEDEEVARRIDELRSVILRAEEYPNDYPNGVSAEEEEYNELCALLEKQGRP